MLKNSINDWLCPRAVQQRFGYITKQKEPYKHISFQMLD